MWFKKKTPDSQLQKELRFLNKEEKRLRRELQKLYLVENELTITKVQVDSELQEIAALQIKAIKLRESLNNGLVTIELERKKYMAPYKVEA